MKTFLIELASMMMTQNAIAATCDFKFDGCKTGALQIVVDGNEVTECEWLNDVPAVVAQLAETGVCRPSPAVCNIKSSNCKDGAAWLELNGEKLTECLWMAEFKTAHRAALKAGVCKLAATKCEYKFDSAQNCKTGAGKIYIGQEKMSECMWLADASSEIVSLRRHGICQ